jgi:hypothetical protein
MTQTISVTTFAEGLQAPTKIILTEAGNLLVAEGSAVTEDGTNLPNTGRLSLLNREGERRILLEGLPAGPSGPSADPLGPTALALQAPSTLFIAIGQGDSAQPSPSSPLFSTVLQVQFSLDIDAVQGSFALTPPADHATLAAGETVTLDNDQGEQAEVSVLASFPLPNSNLFGLALEGESLFVVNASNNTVDEVHTGTGEIQPLVQFAQLTNPTDQGPPMIDAVPDSIRVWQQSEPSMPLLLVPLLSGFPFAEGVSEVHSVDIVLRSESPFITGLTRAIDVLPLSTPIGEFFLVLEYAPPLVAGPGRLLLFTSPESAPQVLVDSLETPTHMALDPVTNELFITELFTGRIIHIGLLN